MKCDNCDNRTGYTLGKDECGAGNFFEYCAKGHWEGGGPIDEEEYEKMIASDDPWEDCDDYKEQEEKKK